MTPATEFPDRGDDDTRPAGALRPVAAVPGTPAEPGGPRLEAFASFEPVSDSVSAARAFIRETLARWDATDVSDDAVLVVSELVTNAIVHAGTAVEVACAREGRTVRVAVADHHPARQIPALGLDGTDGDEGGRGLILSTSIAASWGVEYARSRKTVWFALDVPDAATSEPVQLAEPVRPAAPVPVLPDEPGVGLVRTTLDGTVLSCDAAAARLTGAVPTAGAGSESDGARAGAGDAAVGRPIGALLGTPGEWAAEIMALARWQGDVPYAPGADVPAPLFASALRVAGSGGLEFLWLLVPTSMRLLLVHPGAGRPATASGHLPAQHPGGQHAADPDTPGVAGGVTSPGGRAHGAGAHDAPAPADRGGDDAAEAATWTTDTSDHALVPDAAEPSTGLDELLQRGVERARDTFGADAAYALLVTDDGSSLVLRGASGLLVSGRSTQPISGPPTAVPVPVRAPGVHADLAEESLDLPLLAGTGVRCLVHVPLLVGGRFIGVFCLASREPGRLGEADAVRLHRATEAFALAVEAARLTELDRRRRGTLSFLAEASDLLAGTLDPSRTMAMLGQLVVPRIASWCAVHAIGDNGRPSLAHVWHPDERRLDGLRFVLGRAEPPEPSSEPGGVAWPLETLLAATRAAARPGDHGGAAPADVGDEVAGELAGSEVISLPLSARGRRLGVLSLGRPRSDPFRPDLVTLAEDISRRAALALDNSRLYSDQVAASQALQRSLLPPALPDVPGVDVSVVYQAAGEGNEVGGDFYDLFTVRRGCWAFAIGDVCGTGPQAAAVTGLARHSLRLLARRREAIPEVLTQLNAAILDEGSRDGDNARFLTLLYGELRPRRRGGVRINLASAGHPLPLRLRPDGSVEAVCTPQPLLGVMDDLEFTTETVLLEPGDVLLCVTDGVTERRSGSRMLGEDGLAQVLAGCRGLSAAAVAARVQRAVESFAPTPASDDMAVMVMRASGLPHRGVLSVPPMPRMARGGDRRDDPGGEPGTATTPGPRAEEPAGLADDETAGDETRRV